MYVKDRFIKRSTRFLPQGSQIGKKKRYIKKIDILKWQEAIFEFCGWCCALSIVILILLRKRLYSQISSRLEPLPKRQLQADWFRCDKRNFMVKISTEFLETE